VAQFEAAVSQWTDRHPPQFVHWMPNCVEHLPNLPVASLADGDSHRRLPVLPRGGRQKLHLGRLRTAAVDVDAASETLEVVRIR
jgi:hypothetical protein